MSAPIPHSPEAEAGALGCVLMANGTAGQLLDQLDEKDFHDVRHLPIFRALVSLQFDGRPLDVPTLAQLLRDQSKLEDAGGLQYVSALPDQTPSSANFPSFLETVKDRSRRRQMLCEADAIRRTALDTSVPVETSGNVVATTFSDGLDYDVANDPNAILGLRDGKTTRYLCRGYGAWIIAPSGIGKSVLLHQMGCLFTLGQPVFGIAPVRPLRVLMLQAENDLGDVAEMMQGAAAALGIDHFSPEVTTLDRNLRIITEHQKIGQAFCRWLGREIERFSAELVLVDPLLSFAGIDVSRQDQCSMFLRSWLNPMLSDTGAALIGAHHTGKPKSPKDTRGMTPLDYAYQGLGSSELVNWARAIGIIVPHPEAYELKLVKRGARAGAVHPNGEPTTSVWMRHADGKLWWEQLNEPVEPEAEKTAVGGRPSKVEEVLALGLGKLLDALTEPGVSQNELAKRIESFAAKSALDVSLRTCKEVVKQLVANKAVKKTEEGLYVKA